MKLSAFIDLIKSGDFIVLDTETTGLNDTAEICQIAIIDSAGNVLLDTLVKPTLGISESATLIHGISNKHVNNMPTWASVAAQIKSLIIDRDVIVYNADFDIRIMRQSAKAVKSEWTRGLGFWHCAMLAYAEFYGDWNDYRESYRWQRLSDACEQQGIAVIDAHNALADCRMTLALVQKMTEQETETK